MTRKLNGAGLSNTRKHLSPSNSTWPMLRYRNTMTSMKKSPSNATLARQVWERFLCKRDNHCLCVHSSNRYRNQIRPNRKGVISNCVVSQQVQPVHTGTRDCVHIESDHEPLKAALNNPAHKSPKRLQRMLMPLQNYSLDVQYKKGELMWIFDALSYAYRNTTEFVQHDTSLVCSIEEIDHSENLSIAPYRIAEFRRETASDVVIQSLIASIKSGWAPSKKQCDPVLTPYYDSEANSWRTKD